MPFSFDNTFAREMQGFWSPARPARVAAPALIVFNTELANELGLDAEALRGERGARLLSGAELPPGAEPLAQAYAGHQFGHFVPQLGDGRALLLGEVVDRAGTRRDIQLKGSGPTTFSRGGDGLAALGPVLREYLVSEAMHALGVPTTRALAAVATGGSVYREVELPGAVLTRVATSHLRVGTFQYFALRGETARVAQLADYAIARHFEELTGEEDRFLELLRAVCDRQARLVARWMQVGFVHGVMNTDNMAIAGETIDYGPCAFMERYSPDTVFSSIDRNGRYAYGRQPRIAQWNLARLAETLLPHLDEDTDRAIARATEVLEGFVASYEARWLEGMRAKLGLVAEEEGDAALVQAWLDLLQSARVDFTQGFRALCDVGGASDCGNGEVAGGGANARLRALFGCGTGLDDWLARWRQRLARETTEPDARAKSMRLANPAFVPRNEKVEDALRAAIEGDFAPFHELLAVVRRPFDEQPGREAYREPAPADAEPYRTFCGT